MKMVQNMKENLSMEKEKVRVYITSATRISMMVNGKQVK